MNSLKLSRWLLLGGVSYLLFAIIKLPASVAINLLAPDGAGISGVTGSAWNGAASTVSTNIATFSDVRWSLNPWKFVLLKVSADVNAKLPGGAIRTEVNASLFSNSGTAKDLRGVLKLEQFGPTLQLPIQFTGTAGLRFDELSWADGALVSATGEIQLADVSEPSSDTQLGNFSMVFAPAENDATNVVFSDTEAVFKLGGNVLLSADKSYSADVSIRPTNQTPATVSAAISALGANRDAGGNFTFKSQGSY